MRGHPGALSAWIAGCLLLGIGAGAQVPSGSLGLQLEWSATGLEASPLDHPMGIAIAPSGQVLVADSGNARIVVYEPDGTAAERWDLPRGARPVGLAARPDGRVLVADYTGDRLLLLGPHGELLTQWGQTGTEPGQLRAPSGVAALDNGHALVVEFMGQRVQELDESGAFVRFFGQGPRARAHVRERTEAAGAGEMKMTIPDAVPGNSAGLFVFPTDVALAPDGTVYVSNSHGYEILVFDADGALRAAWGRKGSGAGQWEVPTGLATDAAGNLYVADSANFRVQGLDPGGHVFLVSRADERWYRTTRRIYSPMDVAVDARGRLFVADFAGSRVQRFQLSHVPGPADR